MDYSNYALSGYAISVLLISDVLCGQIVLYSCRIQRLCVDPSVAKLWQEQHDALIESLKGKSLVLAGDGRNDSPGYSAQYCSYSLMDVSSKAIAGLEVLKDCVCAHVFSISVSMYTV